MIQEQDDAIYFYARSMLRREHESRNELLHTDQELKIDELMMLLSRDTGEKYERVLGVATACTTEQEGDVRAGRCHRRER